MDFGQLGQIKKITLNVILYMYDVGNGGQSQLYDIYNST